MPKKSNNEKKKDAEAAGRPPKKTKQANKILIVDKCFCLKLIISTCLINRQMKINGQSVSFYPAHLARAGRLEIIF